MRLRNIREVVLVLTAFGIAAGFSFRWQRLDFAREFTNAVLRSCAFSDHELLESGEGEVNQKQYVCLKRFQGSVRKC